MSQRKINLKVAISASIVLFATSCGTVYRGAEFAVSGIANSSVWHVGRHGGLTELEKKWADIAWAYFENNYNGETGFVNSTDRYPVASMWHVADYIAALYCARELKLIESKDFDEKFSKLIHQLNTMELAFSKLPNTLYNTRSGEMVNYANQAEELGWAIIDVGRLLFWLNVIKAEVPEFSEYIDRVVLRFSFCDAVDDDGRLYSAQKINGELETILENGIGYTDYAQSGFRLWGISTHPWLKYDPRNTVKIYDIEFEYDSDRIRSKGAYGALLSLPYLLAGVESKWDMPANFGADDANGEYFRLTAEKVYKVQEKRYLVEGISTARTDHQLNRPPYYIQDAIFGGGYPWSVLSDRGENHARLSLVSTRAVFGMWALWKTPYTDHLMEITRELYDQNRGWYEGRYEISGDYERAMTISTNAMVLEALTYKITGPLFEIPMRNNYVLYHLSDKFFHPNGCLPELER